MRSCGILMPVSSLPSPYGIGCFSKEAYEFVDQLKNAGQSFWQILPLGPTSYGDSPYQSFSTFAGNPYFIDLEKLKEQGLLSAGDLEKEDFGSREDRVDYARLYEARFRILKKAYSRSHIEKKKDFREFLKEEAAWLPDYALFMALKDSFGGRSWLEWDEDLKLRDKQALKAARERFKDEITFYEFLQYLFYQQWRELKEYANSKGIGIIGDVPIYVALDSADAWAAPELFQFEEDLKPSAVAGCPPDAFSEDGQLWGNPLYDWDYHKETGYAWWLSRMGHCFRLYDKVRIDHFRGFDAYYSIPFGDENARGGHWEKGPGYALFAAMKKEFRDLPVIAEDLGFLTPSVLRLLKRTGFPGMKVLQFAFDSRDDSDYQPHNYINNCVVYTGTHDNDTVRGWFKGMKKKDREYCVKYMHLEHTPEKEVPWEFIRQSYMTVADLVIIPIQEFLSIGSEGRINTPSTLGGNWEWRMKKGAFKKKFQKKAAAMAKLYARLPKALPES